MATASVRASARSLPRCPPRRKSSFGRPARDPRPLPEAPADRVTVALRPGAASAARGPPRHHAATAHTSDDAYMAAFDSAYAEMEAAAGRAPVAAAGPPRASRGPKRTVVTDVSVAVTRVAALGRQWYKGPLVPEGRGRLVCVHSMWSMRQCARMRVCVCASVCVCLHLCKCVCLCVSRSVGGAVRPARPMYECGPCGGRGSDRRV